MKFLLSLSSVLYAFPTHVQNHSDYILYIYSTVI